MKVDLIEVMKCVNEESANRSKLRAVMLDLYPTELKDINILLAVYEAGIPYKLKHEKKIDEERYIRYLKKVVDEYGMQEKEVIKALDMWIELYLEEAVSNDFSKKVLLKEPSDEMELSKNHSEKRVTNKNTIINEKDFYVEYRGIWKHSDESYVVNLYVENNSDDKICVTISNFLVNKYNLSLANNWSTIVSNSRYLASANYNFVLDVENLEQYQIDEIDELDICVSIYTEFLVGDLITKKTRHIILDEPFVVK